MSLDIPSIDGTDIDFSGEWVEGLAELKMAARDRILNAITFDDLAFGEDLFQSLGRLGDATYAQTLGLRCSNAIMNDQRFVSVDAKTPTQTPERGTFSVALAFDVEAEEGETFSLEVLIADGVVKFLDGV